MGDYLITTIWYFPVLSKMVTDFSVETVELLELILVRLILLNLLKGSVTVASHPIGISKSNRTVSTFVFFQFEVIIPYGVA